MVSSPGTFDLSDLPVTKAMSMTYAGIRKQKSEVKTAEGLTYQGGEG